MTLQDLKMIKGNFFCIFCVIFWRNVMSGALAWSLSAFSNILDPLLLINDNCIFRLFSLLAYFFLLHITTSIMTKRVALFPCYYLWWSFFSFLQSPSLFSFLSFSLYMSLKNDNNASSHESSCLTSVSSHLYGKNKRNLLFNVRIQQSK